MKKWNSKDSQRIYCQKILKKGVIQLITSFVILESILFLIVNKASSKTDAFFIYRDPRLFHGGDPYHIENTPVFWTADQLTGFYMIERSVVKELKLLLKKYFLY